MKIKTKKISLKDELIQLLQLRIKQSRSTKQQYEQNPNLMQNVKVANIEAIQNELIDLEKLLKTFTEY